MNTELKIDKIYENVFDRAIARGRGVMSGASQVAQNIKAGTKAGIQGFKNLAGDKSGTTVKDVYNKNANVNGSNGSVSTRAANTKYESIIASYITRLFNVAKTYKNFIDSVPNVNPNQNDPTYKMRHIAYKKLNSVANLITNFKQMFPDYIKVDPNEIIPLTYRNVINNKNTSTAPKQQTPAPTQQPSTTPVTNPVKNNAVVTARNANNQTVFTGTSQNGFIQGTNPTVTITRN